MKCSERINFQVPNYDDQSYQLICRHCPQFLYIGETSRKAKERYYDHRSYITNRNLDTAAGAHFNSKGHNITDMSMLPFEKIRPANNVHTRKIREKLWINRYQAVRYGENKQKSS